MAIDATFADISKDIRHPDPAKRNLRVAEVSQHANQRLSSKQANMYRYTTSSPMKTHGAPIWSLCASLSDPPLSLLLYVPPNDPALLYWAIRSYEASRLQTIR